MNTYNDNFIFYILERGQGNAKTPYTYYITSYIQIKLNIISLALVLSLLSLLVIVLFVDILF